jgi:FKBP-type peptidyl-prolyl cis-trans isomerase
MADDAFAAREAGGVDTWHTGQILEGIARNPNASLTLLEQLRSKTGALTRELAANPNCSNELLTRLIASDPIWAKIGLAENPKTEEKQRRRLMEEVANAIPPRNSRDDVITAIASNNHAPNWWLEAAAAADLGWSVNRCLAGNPSTPPDALVRLARHRHGSIRVRCAGNPSTPIQALEELIEGKHSDLTPVSNWAFNIRTTAASNPSLPRALLDRLIKHPSTSIRAGVLENEGAPIEWLESAAKLANVTFRRSVAGNQRTPAKILANLASDSDLWVRVQLLLNASTPIETETHVSRRLFGNSLQELNWINKQLEKSTEEVKQACDRGDLLFANLRERKYAVPTYLASPRPLAALMMVSAGPVIPPRQLIRHARSTDWLLRAAVARNRATPNKQLKKLAKDVHPLVADFARKTLASTLEYCEGPVSIDKARVVREISSYHGIDFSDPFWIFFSPPEPLRLILLERLPIKLIYRLFGQFLGQLSALERINFAISLTKNKFLDEIKQDFGFPRLPSFFYDIFSEFYDELPLHLIKALEGPDFFSLGFRSSNPRLLSMLAKVGSTSMKEDVARNLHCSRDTLAALAKSRSASVRKVVEDRLQLDPREPTKEENGHAELTVGNPGVSPESQQQEWDESQEQLGTKVIALIRLALQRESIGDDEFEAHCDRLSMEDLIRAAKSVLESREDYPQWEAAGRPAADGDRVTIDFAGTLDEVAFQGGTASDFPFVLGEGRMLADFETGVRGGSEGDERTFPVAFPSDYGSAELAGKTAQFKVTIKKVEAPRLPTASVYSPHWGLRLLAAIHPDTSEEQRRLLTWDDDPDVSALARRLSGDRRAIPL